jgi:4a-hydroxytetrahydrobiopterin dehydratase
MWQEIDKGLYKRFAFKDFKEAFAFMERVAKVAEAQHHHPRWENEYSIVQIWLSTHEYGGRITEKDKILAAAIDAVEQP